MFLSFQGLLRTSLCVSVAAYTVGVVLAGTVTALGSYRVITAVLAELPSAGTRTAAVTVGAGKKHADEEHQATDFPRAWGYQQERRAHMTPLHAGLAVPASWGLSVPRIAEPAFFGSSSRYWGRPARRDRDDEDETEEDRPQTADTYRTMCVRLCDGYYFPISFSVTRDRLARDAKTCDNSCGGQARLFIYRNPGADVEDMVDLRGKPYRQLSTAFLYRTEYVPACRCKPNPWDAEAKERHRMYALAAAKRKGSKQAAAELAALSAKLKRDRTTQPAQVAASPEVSTETMPQPQAVNLPRRQDQVDGKPERMGLGARTSREPRNRASRSSGRDPEWMNRALGRPIF